MTRNIRHVVDEIELKVDLILSGYPEVIDLIKDGKAFSAICMLGVLDSSIFEEYEHLTELYSMFHSSLNLLERYNSPNLTPLKEKKSWVVFLRLACMLHLA